MDEISTLFTDTAMAQAFQHANGPGRNLTVPT